MRRRSTPSESSGPEKSSGPQYLIIAVVLRPHGVRGELSIKLLTKFPERMQDHKYLFFGTSPENPQNLARHQITSARYAKDDQWLLRVKGVDTREQAEDFRSKYIFVSLADAVPLADDEVYLFQVIGLAVQTQHGEIIGKVVDVIETGANDVYVIQSEKYKEVLIPAIKGVILDIDLNAGLMKVNLPDGLLPDEASK